MKFKEDITRIGFPITAVKIWADGESDGLKKLIGFGYLNQLFVCKDKRVTLICDIEEFDGFDKALASKLDNDFFNFLCDRYLGIIEKSEAINSDKDRVNLLLELWPIMNIFHEISLDPKLVSGKNLRRLIRIRSNNQNFFYDQIKKLEQEDEFEEYYLFRGEIKEGKPNFEKLK